MFTGLDAIPDSSTYDLIVVGAGAGGMAAALFAAIKNQKVLLVERTGYVGGTSALSAGLFRLTVGGVVSPILPKGETRTSLPPTAASAGLAVV